MGYAARALLLHKVVIGTDNAKRSVKPRSARAPQPDFIFSGSSRTRRLRIPEYLKKNPIIFRKPPARSKKWKEKLLDSECMLKNAGVEKAEVVERLVLSNQKLTGAVISDLKAFSSLKYLDLGDNNVALCHLDQLPALQELHLHCNGISQIQLESGMFPMLRVLGLGYNQLSSDAIQNLTKIPRLEELDLTYNGIIDLPPGMESFLSLKKLSLRRNLIRNESAWLTLANIVHLQVLDISENALRGIPSDFLRRTTGFGSLSFLDISYNFVSAESDLLALAGFVCLEIVDVRGNPLVKASKKDRLKDVYPILYSNLVDPCDMSIIILDPTSESDVEHILRPDHTVNTEGLLEGAKEQVKPPDRDKTFLTSLNANGVESEETISSESFHLDSSSFADSDWMGVGEAYHLLKEAYMKPLVYHTSKSEHSFQEKTAAVLRRENHAHSKKQDHQNTAKYMKSICKMRFQMPKRFQIPKPLASIKLDQQLEKRLKALSLAPDPKKTSPNAMAPRPAYNDEVEDILNLIIDKLQVKIETNEKSKPLGSSSISNEQT